MASENSSQPEPENDPAVTIKKILEIVENLHKIIPQSQNVETATSASVELEKPKSSKTKKNTLVEVQEVIPNLQHALSVLNDDVYAMQEVQRKVGYEVRKQFRSLVALGDQVNSSETRPTKRLKKDLEELTRDVFNLMSEVPLLPNKPKKQVGKRKDIEEDYGNYLRRDIICLPGIHANAEHLKRRAVFREVEDKFKELSTERKICLLSFAVFSENSEVNRTMLMYWWIGEGILKVGEVEKDVKEILNEFTEKKLIEVVENKRKVEPNSYKMAPFVHSSVVVISKEIGLFDIYHEGRKSDLNKVCLVGGSSRSSQVNAKARQMEAREIETVFNVSERFPDYTFKWFSDEQACKMSLSKAKYRNLKVFYLGRWERTAKRHIEVENPDLMKNFKNMSKLRLLSFQGISRIEKLDDAICKLHELIILDLRACYDLEKLPENISSLRKLIYLDLSDCYMIDRIPKKLSWLDNLEVLKGFVVSDADEETVCKLGELKGLKKLRNLSVVINRREFGVAQLIESIEGFGNLEKLKVAWGGTIDGRKEKAGLVKNPLLRALTFRDTRPKNPPAPPERKLPTSLKKLNLQCFPDVDLPIWLKPENLLYLEKLYIKGGTELAGFGELPLEKPTKCNVKVLRLKFLPKLKVEWRELSQLYFPKLELLEKYQCPQVGLSPCDGIGIWRKP